MGVLNRKRREIHAKIVLYGPEGAGTSTNLRFIQRKLKREHRGEMRMVRPGRTSAGTYEYLPVNLGPIRGFQTSINVYSVPPGDEHAALRRELLEDVDGVVFVADLRPDRHAATDASLKELVANLSHYRRGFEDVELVVQYNHRDEVPENAVEQLHRVLGVQPAASFEAVASEGTGVLATLTTLSKRILGRLRNEADQAAGTRKGPGATGGTSQRTAEFGAPPVSARATIETESKEFRIESGGPVRGNERDLEVPIVLVEERSGRRVELCLRLNLEPR